MCWSPQRRSCPTPAVGSRSEVEATIEPYASCHPMSILILYGATPNWRCTTETQAYIRHSQQAVQPTTTCLRVDDKRSRNTFQYDATSSRRCEVESGIHASKKSGKETTRTTLTRWQLDAVGATSWMLTDGRTARWRIAMMARTAAEKPHSQGCTTPREVSVLFCHTLSWTRLRGEEGPAKKKMTGRMR
ncbi:unnamed protein product, partial [Trichogramma brassicae]